MEKEGGEKGKGKIFHVSLTDLCVGPGWFAPSQTKTKHAHVPPLLTAVFTERRLASQYS